jgi:adenine-specific DNA-methyltransferase
MQRQIRLGLVEFRDDHTEPPFRKAHLLPVPDELDDEPLTENDNFESDEENDEEIGLQVMSSVIYKQSQVSVKYLRKLLGGKLFNNPKDHEILARLVSYCLGDDASAFVVDFFAGSASTAETVLRLNQRDGGTRKIVTIQLPESCDDKSAAYKAGYPTIADIARERIRRVIQKIHDEADLVSPAPDNLGFKSFKLAPSNFKQWRGDDIDNAEQLTEQLQLFVQSEKDGANVTDMLYELLLKAGFPLTAPLECLQVEGAPVYSVNGGELLLVLEAFSFEMILPLLVMKPKEIACLDSIFHGNDALKTNLDLQCRDARVAFTCV